MKNIKKIIFILLLSMFCIPNVKADFHYTCADNTGNIKTKVEGGQLVIEWYNMATPYVNEPYRTGFALTEGVACQGGKTSNPNNGHIAISGTTLGSTTILEGEGKQFVYYSYNEIEGNTIPINSLTNFGSPEYRHYKVTVSAQQLYGKKVIAMGNFEAPPEINNHDGTLGYVFVSGWKNIGCTPEYDCTSCSCSNYVNKNDGTKHYSMSGVNTETGQGINASCNNKGECIF